VRLGYHAPAHTAPSRSAILEAALGYARKKVPVFPVRNKTPLTHNGYKSASSDPSRVTSMFNAAPNATGFGIPTGRVSGLVVVDRDGDSEATQQQWEKLPLTVEVRTARGRHRYYRVPKNTQVKSRKLTPEIDLKGYLTLHAGGNAFLFHNTVRANLLWVVLQRVSEWLTHSA
jgi:hypothetical protein